MKLAEQYFVNKTGSPGNLRIAEAGPARNRIYENGELVKEIK